MFTAAGRSLPSAPNHSPIPYIDEPRHAIHWLPRCTQPGAVDTAAFLKLNVGGCSYRLRLDTLRRRARCSLLFSLAGMSHSKRVLQADAFIAETDEYYFERSSHLFEFIYRYYATGWLHRPADVCARELLDELDFWGVPPSQLSACCVISDDDLPLEPEPEPADPFKSVCCGDARRRVWNLIEVPSSSGAAKLFAFVSISFVLASNVGLVLGSIPQLQVNVTNSTDPQPHPVLENVETGCVVWFTAEYLAKMAVAAQRWQTFSAFLSMVDLVAILPFYLELTLRAAGLTTAGLGNLKGAFLVVRILRVLRVVRIFKLGRYSAGLQTFAVTLTQSFRQLCMMGMVMLTGVVFFSTLVYFIEKDEPDTDFHSIPAGFWWCIVTMTTTGYGDIVPTTLGGKLVGSCAIACGVLVLALPITIIVDNFMKVSGHERIWCSQHTLFLPIVGCVRKCAHWHCDSLQSLLLMMLLWVVDAKLARLCLLLVALCTYSGSWWTCFLKLPAASRQQRAPCPNARWSSPDGRLAARLALPLFLWHYCSSAAVVNNAAAFALLLLDLGLVLLCHLCDGRSPVEVGLSAIFATFCLHAFVAVSDRFYLHLATGTWLWLKHAPLWALLLLAHPRCDGASDSYEAALMGVSAAFGLVAGRSSAPFAAPPDALLAFSRGHAPLWSLAVRAVARLALGATAACALRSVARALLTHLWQSVYEWFGWANVGGAQFHRVQLAACHCPQAPVANPSPVPPQPDVGSFSDSDASLDDDSAEASVAAAKPLQESQQLYNIDLPVYLFLMPLMCWFVAELCPVAFDRLGL